MKAKTMTRFLAGLAAVLVAFAPAAGSASASETLSPWYHVSVGARPENIGTEPAQSEVQEITVGTEAAFELFVGEAETFAGLYATEPYLKIFGRYGAKEPTAANIQAGLEKVYGAGNIEVVEKVPGSGSPFLIKSVGEDALRPVPQIKVSTVAGEVGYKMLTPFRPDGHLVVTAINVGDATTAEGSPVVVTDRLPEHFKAVTAEGAWTSERGKLPCEIVSSREVRCTLEKRVPFPGIPTEEAGTEPPYGLIEVVVGVVLEEGAATGEINEAVVSGGGAPTATAKHTVTLAEKPGEPTPFGVETYELSPEEPGGVPDVQAGSHPFQLTTTFNLNQAGEGQAAGALPKDLSFKLPAGLVGNPDAYPRCPLATFTRIVGLAGKGQGNLCPADTALGVASVIFLREHGHRMEHGILPVYNLEPSPGEAARFGFQPATLPVFLSAGVRTGEDYGVTVHVSNLLQTIGFAASSVTFWGVPGDSRHDNVRGYGCLENIQSFSTNPCAPFGQTSPPPFLDMPTSCSGNPLATEVLVSSWSDRSVQVSPTPDPTVPMPTMSGCGLLDFGSEIGVSVDDKTTSTPSGLTVDVHVPQQAALNPNGDAPADVKNITVALPEGVVLNPSAADGLAACTPEQVGYEGMAELNKATEPGVLTAQFKRLVYNHATEKEEASTCPDASKIATATITTPLLPHSLKGFVFLASPQNFASPPLQNPFGSLVAMYLVAEDETSGTIVKLPGHVSLGATGQITASFENNPQLPFEDAEVKFFGGERAPLATPAHCGGYETSALFEPWTNGGQIDEVLHSHATFNIDAGPGGSACPGASLPFAPSLTSGSTSVNAGGFTPLTTTISREDGQQNIQAVTLHYPPGLSGILTGVPLCGEAQANAGTCPEASLIGETIVGVGVGGDPFSVTGGKVYLTEKYAGAPFGLSIVNPAKAGPFDLQEGRPVVVRAKIEIDPVTAALTVTTDASGPHAIPTIIEGIPLQIKHVNVTITRQNFTFNPTDCNPMQVSGTVGSDGGISAPVSIPFQVTNCAALGFKPSFKVSTSGHTSRKNGASLKVRLSYPKGALGSQANIKSVKVDLPKQLPSRLTTLQKACTASQFATNPAGCPAASIVGHAVVHTPLLPVVLEGPAYFVSHGGEEFPNLVIVLQGDGVTVELVGDTFIKGGVTSSTFRSTPDVPFESFELTLPEEQFSALAANTNLCRTGRTIVVTRRVRRKVHGKVRFVKRRVKKKIRGLMMPTAFTAQNGAVIHQNTPIAVTGCARQKAKHARRHGRR